jgi:undecaprenyl diphosphate synthase
LPEHVAIIMDGNGRWAKAHGLPRIEGHRQGATTVRRITTFARQIGIRYLTLYAFSQQNFFRPDREVRGLMKLLIEYVRLEWKTVLENGIRLSHIGEIHRLPQPTRDALDELVQASAHNRDMVLTLALAYGGREEICRAARSVAEDIGRGELSPDDVDEAVLGKYLYTRDMPDPDLVIRTSGEQRLSNFLLWQIAYSEIYITDRMWPEFDENDFTAAMWDYYQRERRFGKTSDQLGRSAGKISEKSGSGRSHNRNGKAKGGANRR